MGEYKEDGGKKLVRGKGEEKVPSEGGTTVPTTSFKLSIVLSMSSRFGG